MRNFFRVLATPSLKVSENTYWTLIFSTFRKSQQPNGPQLMRVSRDFRWGLGEAIRNPGSSVTIKALTLFFFVLNLFNRSPMCFCFSKKAVISQGSRWGPTFSMGSNFLQGAWVSNCFFPTEACYFIGGSRPLPPTSGSANAASVGNCLFSVGTENPRSLKIMQGSRNFHQVGGVKVHPLIKKLLQSFLCFFFILQKFIWFYQEAIIFQGLEVLDGVKHFQWGSNFFQGAVSSNCSFPTASHITCNFPRGNQIPCPPPPRHAAPVGHL